MLPLPAKVRKGVPRFIVLRINETSRVKQRLMAMLLGDYPCQKE